MSATALEIAFAAGRAARLENAALRVAARASLVEMSVVLSVYMTEAEAVKNRIREIVESRRTTLDRW